MLESIWPKVVLFATSLWHTLCQMSPYLLLGFFVAGILSVLVSQRWVERHLGGETAWSVIKAALLGVPLPLCSCGVIPVAASLRSRGASRGATVSFLVSTPQTGVDSFFVTWGLLGPMFALFRPVTALLSGICGGLVVMWLGGRDERHAGKANAEEGNEARSERLRACLRYGFYTLPRSIGWPVVSGIVLAAAISVLFAGQDWARLGQGIHGMLLMLVVSIPLYVCSTGSVPIAAALIAQGISPGAAFVFLTAGPATNTATIATVWKVLGRRVTILYLSTIAAFSLAFGFLLDYLFAWQGKGLATFAPAACCPTAIEHLSAAAMLLVLTVALLVSPRPQTAATATAGEEQLSLGIGGMNCSHCAHSVEQAIRESQGVSGVQVDLASGKATIIGKNIDVQELRQRIESLGYRVENQ